jgi:hypothetical protein
LSKDKTSIQISNDLYESIERIIKDKQEFRTPEEYIEYIIEKSLENEKAEQVYSEEEEKKVEQHLKDLGYM